MLRSLTLEIASSPIPNRIASLLAASLVERPRSLGATARRALIAWLRDGAARVPAPVEDRGIQRSPGRPAPEIIPII